MGDEKLIDQAYADYEKNKDDKVRNIRRSLSNKEIGMIGAILLAFAWAVFIKEPPLFDTKQAIIVGIIGSIVIYLWMNKDTTDNIIPPEQIRAILKKDVIRMQKEGTMPEGQIRINPQFILTKLEGKANQYHWHFNIFTIENMDINYVAKYDPYTGKGRGIDERMEGVSFKDMVDLKYIPSKELLWMKDYGKEIERYGRR